MINLDEIKNQVSKVIKYTQGFEPDVDYLINTWYKSKKDFIDLFNGELYYRSFEKIHIDLSEEDITYKVKDFCNMLMETFPQYEDLIYFIKENKTDFFSNILSKDFIYKNYYIKSGIKISKAIKEFVNNEVDLYFIQTACSRVIQENKLSGYLYLSVHPLDYLSSSENNSNWRSCHALDGAYRAGNLSYMLDSSTIVCYIANEENELLHSFPSSVKWNNKKWRMLLFVSDNRNALFAGRHYPFFSESLMENVRKTFIKLERLHDRDWSYWHNDSIKSIRYEKFSEDNEILYDKYIPIRRELIKIEKLIKDKSTLHFNDLLNSSCYVPYYSWEYFNYEPITFTIGAKVLCLRCNSEFLEEPDSMICSSCQFEIEDKIICDCCGNTIPAEDAIYINTESIEVCPDCFSEEFGICAGCGDIYRIENLWYNDFNGCYYCADCKEGE